MVRNTIRLFSLAISRTICPSIEERIAASDCGAMLPSGSTRPVASLSSTSRTPVSYTRYRQDDVMPRARSFGTGGSSTLLLRLISRSRTRKRLLAPATRPT